jgi:hypothetical protein
MSDVNELKPAARIAVWDPVVRYGHWLLVAAFAVAYLTAEEEGAVPSCSMCGLATWSRSCKPSNYPALPFPVDGHW